MQKFALCFLLLAGCVTKPLTHAPVLPVDPPTNAPPSRAAVYPKAQAAVLPGSTNPPPATVWLAWDPCPWPEVVSNAVYWGPTTRNYTNNFAQAASATNNVAAVTGLFPGALYYFAVTARDALGRESDYSEEVAYRVPAKLPVPSVKSPCLLFVESTTNLMDPHWAIDPAFPPYAIEPKSAGKLYRLRLSAR